MPYADPKKKREYNLEYTKTHKEELRVYHSQYRKKHRKKNIAYLHTWKIKNPDYDKVWRAANRSKKNKNQQNYRLRHPEKIRVLNACYATKRTEAGGHFTEKEWLKLCRRYNSKCLRCIKRKKLTPDHIVPVSKGGTSNISNIQPLCQSCNSAKGAKTIDYKKGRNVQSNTRALKEQ